jgi:hypothetical protein
MPLPRVCLSPEVSPAEVSLPRKFVLHGRSSHGGVSTECVSTEVRLHEGVSTEVSPAEVSLPRKSVLHGRSSHGGVSTECVSTEVRLHGGASPRSVSLHEGVSPTRCVSTEVSRPTEVSLRRRAFCVRCAPRRRLALRLVRLVRRPLTCRVCARVRRRATRRLAPCRWRRRLLLAAGLSPDRATRRAPSR